MVLVWFTVRSRCSLPTALKLVVVAVAEGDLFAGRDIAARDEPGPWLAAHALGQDLEAAVARLVVVHEARPAGHVRVLHADEDLPGLHEVVAREPLVALDAGPPPGLVLGGGLLALVARRHLLRGHELPVEVPEVRVDGDVLRREDPQAALAGTAHFDAPALPRRHHAVAVGVHPWPRLRARGVVHEFRRRQWHRGPHDAAKAFGPGRRGQHERRRLREGHHDSLSLSSVRENSWYWRGRACRCRELNDVRRPSSCAG
mmetsp:Transcript_19713/g.59705  ORF Transcript_19713/g.59705 Transcript_19713/m.59705 type:complete len:258 (-) Transcript_19713:380-1153(-)